MIHIVELANFKGIAECQQRVDFTPLPPFFCVSNEDRREA